MLRVYFGDMPDAIYNTSVYFKNRYKKEWIISPRTIEMIRDVDSSEVLGTGAIDSPVMGIISPTSLSGGVKTLILIDHIPEMIFNASNCGDNCAHWLLEIGKEKDITINLRHIMDFGDGEFEIYIINTESVVHNMDELVRIAGRYV
ncbi:MAG: DUF4869 domain-containing protein [Eubacteriales bacterium]|nr:DUF4869 domain-containing protein [Eubacteriales bacterium]